MRPGPDPAVPGAAAPGPDGPGPADGDEAGDWPKVAVDLEIPELVALVEELAASRAGRLALPRRPFAEPAAALDEMDRIWHCRRARAQKGNFRFACTAAVEDVARSRTPGMALPAEVLLAVRDGAEAALDAKKQIRGETRGFERFALEVEALDDLAPFRQACARVFDQRGHVKDSASPALAGIRRDQKRIEEEIERELDRIVKGPSRRFLSDEFSTRRDGRWVVPLAANYKGRIPGLVVGASSTGNTLYVEPFRVVELSNDLRAAEAAEVAEIQRILEELTGILGRLAGEAESMVRLMAELDSLHARAAFADRYRCQSIELARDAGVRLSGARHLLLGEACIGIDLEMPRGKLVLVLSGANAGGKTVSLKILGSLTWLAASGYQVPVEEGGELPFPGGWWCVIGDEQSLANQLSSFSSHAKSVGEVLAGAAPGELVLLDELMSGTDPEEGAAMAVEVLLELARRGTRTVVTTHYGTVKTLAGEQEAFLNASVEFDTEALAPTFRVVTGTPGASRGFEIATRFGLPRPLVEHARIRLGPERVRMAALLDQLETDRLDQAMALDEARKLRDELAEARSELARREREFRTEVHEAAVERAQRLEHELTALRRQVLDAIEAGRLDEAARSVESGAQAAREEPLPEAPPREGWESLSVGDRVQVAGWGVVGTLAQFDRARARAVVASGAMTVEVDATRLERVAGSGAAGGASGTGAGSGGAKAASRQGGGAGRPRRSPPPAAGGEADEDPGGEPAVVRQSMLLGLRTEEARERLEGDIDQALADGLDGIRIVHGFGTGALRGMVERLLKEHRLVVRFRPGGEAEGGRGATVAFFR